MLRLIASVLLLFLLPVSVSSAAPYFPSEPRAERLARLDAFWADWKAVYLAEGCGGAYVDTSGDDKPTWGGSAQETLTVSEAHGYGMLALVLMADRDPAARRLFDGMLAFYQAHPAASDPGLMAWNQTRDCRDAPDGGDSSATDGDLDIALALLLADQRWGGYWDAFNTAQYAILLNESTLGGTMRLGDWATDGEYGGASRSSDFMPATFAAFAKSGVDTAGIWRKIRDRGYAVWGDIALRFAPSTGLVPDFLTGLPAPPRPAGSNFLEGEGDGQFSWNALRFPWRLALDFLDTRELRAAAHLRTINGWIQRKTGGDPLRIATTYRLDGSVPDGQDRGSAAFIAMFAAAAVAGSGHPDADQAWMDRLWAALVAIPLPDEDYYGNTLKLLAMMALSGLWGEGHEP